MQTDLDDPATGVLKTCRIVQRMDPLSAALDVSAVDMPGGTAMRRHLAQYRSQHRFAL
jgi:hypothetical protein